MKFNPGSGKFPRDWECFHPSPYETFDGETFGDMPDMCHRNPRVYEEMINFAQFVIERSATTASASTSSKARARGW